MAEPIVVRRSQPFWLGGAAASGAAVFTHPIDQTKYRSQTLGGRHRLIDIAANTYATGGLRNFWTGLTASFLRQSTYGVTRFGTYAYLKEGRLPRVISESSWNTIVSGAIAGFAAGLTGGPAELILVRMCSDGIKPKENQFKYRNSLEGLYRIAKEEGFARVFRGTSMTCLRSVVLNASQLSSYDFIKRNLIATGHFEDNTLVYLLSSATAGTLATTLCAPIDVVKSRVQAATASGVSARLVLLQSLKSEGLPVLFRGWLPGWLRMMPNTILTFAFLEQLRKMF